MSRGEGKKKLFRVVHTGGLKSSPGTAGSASSPASSPLCSLAVSGKIRLWLGGRECFLAPPTPHTWSAGVEHQGGLTFMEFLKRFLPGKHLLVSSSLPVLLFSSGSQEPRGENFHPTSGVIKIQNL